MWKACRWRQRVGFFLIFCCGLACVCGPNFKNVVVKPPSLLLLNECAGILVSRLPARKLCTLTCDWLCVCFPSKFQNSLYFKTVFCVCWPWTHVWLCRLHCTLVWTQDGGSWLMHSRGAQVSQVLHNVRNTSGSIPVGREAGWEDECVL